MTILVVEDELNISQAVCAYLENSAYKTLAAYDGKQAVELFKKNNPDMVILDLMLPIICGEDVCKIIRQQSRVPIIMLTAKSAQESKIAGLNIGADDYMTKPFSPKELLARIKSLFRRCSGEIGPLYSKMSWNDGDLEVDFEAYTVQKCGKIITLTPSEFKLFASLAKYPGKTFTREELIEIAFGGDFDGYDRTIDSHIKNLRSKIETDSPNPVYIMTVRGVGYKFGCR